MNYEVIGKRSDELRTKWNSMRMNIADVKYKTNSFDTTINDCVGAVLIIILTMQLNPQLYPALMDE